LLSPIFIFRSVMNICQLKLISEIPPSVNHYLAYRAIMKNGKPMAMSYKTPDAIRYQNKFTKYVIRQVKEQKWPLKPNKTQHFYVDCIFYFPRVDMDCNNYFKCMLDAITDSKKVWEDDNVVCERVNGIFYDSANPRIEMIISPVDYIGIFKDLSQLEEFESNCIGCSRYKRNCSILQKAKEGRIQDEIQNGICQKFKCMKEK